MQSKSLVAICATVFLSLTNPMAFANFTGPSGTLTPNVTPFACSTSGGIAWSDGTVIQCGPAITTSAGRIRVGVAGTLAAPGLTGPTTTAGIAFDRSAPGDVSLVTTGSIAFIEYRAGQLAIGSGSEQTNVFDNVQTRNTWIEWQPMVAPVAPSTSGAMRVYVDTADNKLKAKASTGTVTILAVP